MGTKKLEENTIVTENYSIRRVKVRELALVLDNLPAVQAVRGHVMPADVSTELVNDLKNELYIPPICLAGTAGDQALVDGQQRMRAILSALKAGLLTGEEKVLVALDDVRSIDRAFWVLNLSTPVSKVLVGAMEIGGNMSDAIIGLSASPFFGRTKWSSTQIKKSTAAEFALAALAIYGGWKTPESSTANALAWVEANADAITPEMASEAALAIATLDRSADKFFTASLIKGAGGKEARAVLAKLKRKNLFMTVIGAMYDGLDPNDALSALCRLGNESKATVETVDKRGRKTKTTYHWILGGGSSGNFSEYYSRLQVLTAAVTDPAAYPTPAATPKKTAADKVKSEIESIPPQTLAAAMGLELGATK